MAQGPWNPTGINRIRKRSFKRAQQRLALHGFAYYHGRLLTGLPSNRHEQPTTRVRQIDALMIQSTHWSIEEPWTSHGYHIIPSPELRKAGGGLITAIRTSICPRHNISFQDWMSGRLLHVRCYLKRTTWIWSTYIRFLRGKQ